MKNDLHKDEFLVVFLHEYAHLLTHLTFSKVADHGKEFYFCYEELICDFAVNLKITLYL